MVSSCFIMFSSVKPSHLWIHETLKPTGRCEARGCRTSSRRFICSRPRPIAARRVRHRTCSRVASGQIEMEWVVKDSASNRCYPFWTHTVRWDTSVRGIPFPMYRLLSPACGRSYTRSRPTWNSLTLGSSWFHQIEPMHLGWTQRVGGPKLRGIPFCNVYRRGLRTPVV